MEITYLIHHEPSDNYRSRSFFVTASIELANFAFEVLSLIARDDDIVILVRDPWHSAEEVIRVARMTRHGRLFVDPGLPLPPWVEIGKL